VNCEPHRVNKPVSYRIEVKGHLDLTWLDWFEGLTIVNQENGKAVLSGPLPDQAALHGVLARINSLGLTLISVNPTPEG
jgi:hypothetical protein